MEEGWEKTYRFNRKKMVYGFFTWNLPSKKLLLNKLHNGVGTIKKEIYSNIKDSDALENFLNV